MFCCSIILDTCVCHGHFLTKLYLRNAPVFGILAEGVCILYPKATVPKSGLLIFPIRACSYEVSTWHDCLHTGILQHGLFSHVVIVRLCCSPPVSGPALPVLCVPMCCNCLFPCFRVAMGPAHCGLPRVPCLEGWQEYGGHTLVEAGQHDPVPGPQDFSSSPFWKIHHSED